MSILHDPSVSVDPLGDGDRLDKDNARKNYAKVGSARPSSLLYTYGPGAIIDLPHFTIMPTGLDEWDRIWARRDNPPTTIHAPRLLENVRLLIGNQVTELRPFPWQPKPTVFAKEGTDLGVPARVFPQWMRCSGCDRLAPISAFSNGYRNTHPYRPDEAVFEHIDCRGRGGASKPSRQPLVPARYLIACANGHLDEFPYNWWVHEGDPCTVAQFPSLRMVERSASKGASAVIKCDSCGKSRAMSQAQGAEGRARLPKCRGRMPHLDGFDPQGCDLEPRLMLVGASNLWFPAFQSIIDMPRLDPAEKARDDSTRLASVLGDKLTKFGDNVDFIRALLEQAHEQELAELPDVQLEALILMTQADPETDAEREARKATWQPVDLLVPEWRYLQIEPASQHHADQPSGLTLSPREVVPTMPVQVSRVLAVDRLRKVNAVIGFTRIDDFDRINDMGSRLVPLTRDSKPVWVPATQDRGEGIFMQLDLHAVQAWEDRVAHSALWTALKEAHRRNFTNRYSETAKTETADDRLQPPRYWLVHTFAHSLIRQMAMYSGYGAASLSERLYAWPESGSRPAAAGLLICTTASDSDGTLGGLVSLSNPDTLATIVNDALRTLSRCSSDPVCARRVPQDPEDFLHGAACHCCVMASETSCERANRFLDRRLVVSLPGPWSDLAFFGNHDG